MMRTHWLGLASVLAALLPMQGDSRACGCFTPPDPTVPVVQAGERILFAIENGQVTAHIQIQYAGDASDFGWLLPLPSVPMLDLGTDELFNQLINTTQPKYRLTASYEGNCAWVGKNAGGGATGAGGPPQSPGSVEDAGGPLVIQASIGPYDYAVLHADSKDDMLKWLADNHYFVPAGTDDAVGPYIRPGAYFLALKLQSGQSSGDLQPVVVHYASDLAMIPLVLTSVGAKPDMGIQVWMLGAGRAIPHNYYHTVLDDAAVDWLTSGQNYNDVIIAATKEAPGRHTFVTEYAGASSVMQNILNRPGRFGSIEALKGQATAVDFVEYLNANGYPTFASAGGIGPGFGAGAYSSQMLSILGRYVPVPPGLAARAISPSQFYLQISYYLGPYRQQFPQDFTGYTINYKPDEMAAEIDMRVVQPSLAAGGLFDKFPYLTRLYTTLSPAQMDKDPVFSYNRGLPAYSNVHEGTLTYHCGLFSDKPATTPATLLTASGWSIYYPNGTGTPFTRVGLPASQRIEVLSEEGPPAIYADFSAQIDDKLNVSHGCQVAVGRGRTALGGVLVLFLLGGAFLVRARRGT